MAGAQTYLDNVEIQTGLTPRQFIALAEERGFTAPGTKTGAVVAWLKQDHALGHGHATAIAQVIKHRETVDLKNEGITAPPPTSMGRVWLDGKDTAPR